MIPSLDSERWRRLVEAERRRARREDTLSLLALVISVLGAAVAVALWCLL